jgi:hypothetical protein
MLLQFSVLSLCVCVVCLLRCREESGSRTCRARYASCAIALSHGARFVHSLQFCVVARELVRLRQVVDCNLLVLLLQKWEDCWDEVYCCSKSCKEKRRKAKADEAYKVKQARAGEAPSVSDELKQQDSSSDID